MERTEEELVDALRARDERAFAELVDRHSPAMLALARGHVSSREVAEDVVQETWLALLKGIDGFEGRSSLRTWLSASWSTSRRRAGCVTSAPSR